MGRKASRPRGGTQLDGEVTVKVKCDSSDWDKKQCFACSHLGTHERNVHCRGNVCMTRNVPAKCVAIKKKAKK